MKEPSTDRYDGDKYATVSGIKVEKLTDSNWHTWKLRAQPVLVKEGLWKYINLPVNPAERDALLQNRDGDIEAMMTLTLLVSDEMLADVANNLTNACALWGELLRKGTASSAKKQALYLQRLEVEVQKEEGLEDYFSRVMKLCYQVRACGGMLNDVQISGHLLRGLNGDYTTAKLVCQTFRDDVEKVKDTLYATEVQRKEDAIHTRNVDRAMAVRTANQKSWNTNSTSNPTTKPKKFQGDCWNCGKPGHRSSVCRSKGREEDKNDEEKTSDAAGDAPKIKGYMVSAMNSDSKGWIFDSAATEHFTSDKAAFVTYTEVHQQWAWVAGNKRAQIMGVGTVQITPKVGDRFELKNVRYAPEFESLISLRRLMKDGNNAWFTKNEVRVFNQWEKIIMTGFFDESRNFWVLNESDQLPQAFVAKENPAKTRGKTMYDWHRCFGHINSDYVENTEDCTIGMVVSAKPDIFCKPCAVGKATRAAMYLNDKERVPLEEIQIDFWGPLIVESIEGKTGYMAIVDPASKYHAIFTGKDRKSLVANIWPTIDMLERQSNFTVKVIKVDGARELISSEVLKEATRRGIIVQVTTSYTPEQNPAVERSNRFIVEGARTMIDDCHLPYEFWDEAMKTFVYVSNRCFYPSLGRTPYQALFEKVPFVGHLKPFGALAVVHIPLEKRHKIEPKGWQGIFVGYGKNGLRVYNPSTRSFVTSKHVKVYEDSFGVDLLDQRTTTAGRELLKERQLPTVYLETEDNFEILDEGESWGVDDSSATLDHESSPSADEYVPNEGEELSDEVQPERRSTRKKIPTAKASHSWAKHAGAWTNTDDSPRALLTAVSMSADEPTTWKEAMSGPNRRNWLEAAQAEFDSLQRNEVWRRVKRGSQSLISSKWVFKIKTNGVYKARLVARGFTQIEGIDYFETFAPVARTASIRMVLALAARNRLILHQMDVKSAFLYGKIDYEAYMSPPEGIDEEDDIVYRLEKSIYGLKQAPRIFYEVIEEFFLGLGLRKSRCDPSVFFDNFNSDDENEPGEGWSIIVTIYVDDLIIAAKKNSDVQRIKEALNKRFDMTDLGGLKEIVGIEVEQFENGSIFIHQRKYIERLLAKLGMEESTTVSTPLLDGVIPSNQEVDQRIYLSINGAITWPSLGTRPDLSYTASWLSRANSKPTTSHETQQKRALRYLKATKDFGILYKATDTSPLDCFADANWAGDLEDRKSTSGHVEKLSGGAVDYGSTKQGPTAGSSVESEFYAAAESVKAVLWLIQWLEEAGVKRSSTRPTTIKMDSQGAMALANNAKITRYTKHIDVRQFFIRDHIEKGDIELQYVPTNENAADILTKALPKFKFEELRRLLGVVSMEEAKELCRKN